MGLGGGGGGGGALHVQGNLIAVGNLTGWTEGLTTSASVSDASPWVPPTESGDGNDPSTLLSTTQTITQGNGPVSSLLSTISLAVATDLASLAGGPAPTILQAVDTALSQLSSSSKSTNRLVLH